MLADVIWGYIQLTQIRKTVQLAYHVTEHIKTRSSLIFLFSCALFYMSAGEDLTQ